MAQRYLITSALPYANGPSHIGHIAGAYLSADIYVRYLKLVKGADNVLYICGSDEHGAAISMQAIKENTTPQQIVDKYHQILQADFKAMGIEFDKYHRTSAALHHTTAQEFFTNINNQNGFEIISTEQLYDQKFEQFLADRFVKGTCPNCQNPNAYGDQCEKCGKDLSGNELINPISALSGETPILKATTHWYFPLQNWQNFLQQYLEKNQDTWKSQIVAQCMAWLQQGLKARPITRDLQWGIDVPLNNAQGKKLYVWFDAPIGYISSTKAYFEEKTLEQPQKFKPTDWELFWKKQPNQNDNAQLIHFIGKDNIWFHTIMFPAMLQAEGSYILPINVPANQFLNIEGQKISTSRRWGVWINEYLTDFPNQQDVLRYVLTTLMPETKDSEFTWSDFQSKNNNELVATLGNFVNRVLVLSQKYTNNSVASSTVFELPNPVADFDYIQTIETAFIKVSEHIKYFEFRFALNEVMELARIGNKFLQDAAPWQIAKINIKQTQYILFIAQQIMYNLATLMYPFMPFTSQKLRAMLNINKAPDKFEPDYLPENTLFGTAQLLFLKIEDDAIKAQIDKLHAQSTAVTKNTLTTIDNSFVINLNSKADIETDADILPIKTTISYDDFAKLDIRIGTITLAETVPNADKLLKLNINIGLETRTVLSGIAQQYSPNQIIGKQVLLIANLAPRKMKGIDSEGMILMASNSTELIFISPVKPTANGSVVS